MGNPLVLHAGRFEMSKRHVPRSLVVRKKASHDAGSRTGTMSITSTSKDKFMSMTLLPTHTSKPCYRILLSTSIVLLLTNSDGCRVRGNC